MGAERVWEPREYRSVHVLDKEINLWEVESSLGRCKDKQAAGEDGIPNEFYENLPQNWKLFMVSLFNKIMKEECMPIKWSEVWVKMLYKKGQTRNPENYRPISLVNSITKIFTQIIFTRLNNWCEHYNLLPVRAFPSVKHYLLWEKLERVGISTKILKIFSGLYYNAEMRIKNSQGLSDPIRVTEGVLQGEVLSPLLFSLFIADLEDYLVRRGVRGVAISQLVDLLILAYADDIVIVTDSTSG